MLSIQGNNPNKRSTHYQVQSKFEGSIRKVRGEIIKQLILYKEMSIENLISNTAASSEQFNQALAGLIKDKMISQENKTIRINK